MPPSISISAGAASGSFAATAGSVGSDQTVTVTASLNGTSASDSIQLLAPVAPPPLPPIRINSGGGAYTDSLGQSWIADTGYTGGSNYSTSSTVSGTADPALYQNQRQGATQYQFTAPSGSYNVKLRFAEIYYGGSGYRSFNVVINGTTVLQNFDPAAAAGGAMKAVDKTFTVSSSGQIVIQFIAVKDNPAINAIEVIKPSPASKVGAYSGGYWLEDLNGNFAWDGPSSDRLTFFSLNRAGEIPVYGDWSGDGKGKVGLYVDGTWMLDYNGNGVWDGPTVDKTVYFGAPGYAPVVGDWNGTRFSKIGVHKDGTWVLDYNGNFAWDGPSTDKLVYFGGPGYTPMVGDWNGSGNTKIGAQKDGLWVLDYNGNFTWDGPGTDKLIFFGGPGYTPVVGDWNGSGNTKVGAQKDGLWVLDFNGNFTWDGTTTDKLIFFGGPGYTPMVGDWNGSGSDKVGAYKAGQWVLDVNGNFIWDPPADQVIFFGGPGQTPVVGKW